MVGIDIVNFPNTVLIVDDEPIVVQVLQRVLPRQGLRVTSVSNAEEATDVLQRENFACASPSKPGTATSRKDSTIRARDQHDERAGQRPANPLTR